MNHVIRIRDLKSSLIRLSAMVLIILQLIKELELTIMIKFNGEI